MWGLIEFAAGAVTGAALTVAILYAIWAAMEFADYINLRGRDK